MAEWTILWTAVVGAAVGGILTGLVRRHAIRRSLLDHPSERSSHTNPTPRGGGLAIAVVTLAGAAAATVSGALPWQSGVGLVGGGVLVGLIGWADDLRPRSASLRAAVHSVAALWLLAWVGGVDSLTLGTWSVELGWFDDLLVLGAIVWSINLYNFMDGIDGLAGGQAVLAGAVGTLLVAGHSSGLALIAALIAGASLGFLWWNWPPSRIFMGDVGSGLLGYWFAALALLADRAGGPGILTWLMLGSVFLMDATLTLIRRVLRGERWYVAHRSHAYQRAVQSGWSHARVTVGALLMSGVGAGLAWIGLVRPAWLWPGVAMQVAQLLTVYLLIERRAPMRGA